ncbi:hypothetical protein VCRA2116O29_60139 [Vibrio crassostreae]|nr:hypothetical protein VCRA2119O48_140021 [Vibrio crassostreae]CAK2532373.1 hypothetical protein VCRA2116O29_60139 [Vibrio crassostreae]CAK3780678.1 hypothetical protein VCRA212O16_140095 [Vibrio crassostreae]CAK3915917.1 hypothetical protein VCRA2123O74_70139 [Vibrio crassostreae]
MKDLIVQRLSSNKKDTVVSFIMTLCSATLRYTFEELKLQYVEFSDLP